MCANLSSAQAFNMWLRFDKIILFKKNPIDNKIDKYFKKQLTIHWKCVNIQKMIILMDLL